MVKNTGSAVLSNVVINDMYPAYTTQWARVGILPIVGSDGQTLQIVQIIKLKTTERLKLRQF